MNVYEGLLGRKSLEGRERKERILSPEEDGITLHINI
jgi:hypothetical protein